jgi:protein TonB
MSHALGIAGGVGFTGCIAAGLMLFSRAPEYVEEEEIAEVRAVDIPEPPPPPPQTTAPGTPLPPAPMIFEEAPSTSSVRIAPTPIPITPLLTQIRPNVSLQFSFTPGEFRPSTGNYEPDVNHVFQRSEVDQQVVPIFKKSPSIPTALLDEIPNPRVRVLFVVNINGTVEDVRLIKGVHPQFDRLIIEAISEWRFRPAMRKGRKVRCLTELPVYVKPPHRNPSSTQ